METQTITVAPFAHSNYSRNEELAQNKGQESCCICGRGIKDGAKLAWARVAGGGSHFADVALESGTDNDMGFFPLGSECAKLLPASHKTSSANVAGF